MLGHVHAYSTVTIHLHYRLNITRYHCRYFRFYLRQKSQFIQRDIEYPENLISVDLLGTNNYVLLLT